MAAIIARRVAANQNVELIELDSVETACRILQRELAAMAYDQVGAYRRRYFYQIAARAGLCQQCVSRIASGETRWPRLRTCILLFEALGFKMWLSRSDIPATGAYRKAA